MSNSSIIITQANEKHDISHILFIIAICYNKYSILLLPCQEGVVAEKLSTAGGSRELLSNNAKCQWRKVI